MLERVHIIVTLIAALFVAIVCIVMETEFIDFATKLCITIVLFYTIGCCIKSYFKKKVFKTSDIYDSEEDVPPIEASENKK